MNNNSTRVMRSQRQALANGAVRVHVMLRPEVCHAMRELEAAGYSRSKTDLISRAILEAWQRHASRDVCSTTRKETHKNKRAIIDALNRWLDEALADIASGDMFLEDIDAHLLEKLRETL